MSSPLSAFMTAYLHALNKSLKVIILCSVWLGVSIPLLFALFFFSTNRLRRQPIFIFNVVSICIGITMGLLNIQILVPSLVEPLVPVDRHSVLAYTFFSASAPILVESILMFRLFAVFPYRQTPKRIFFSIFIPLGLLKAGRLGNLIEFMVTFSGLIRNATTTEEMGELSLRHTGPKVEWFLQVVDNSIASVLFLWRLNLNNSLFPTGTAASAQPRSYSSRIRTLFWIAVSNFIFPVIVSITLLVLYFREGDYLKCLMFLISNAYIEIIGVLMATVWSASTHWQGSESHPPNSFPVARFDGNGASGIPTSKTHWEASNARPSASFPVVRFDGDGLSIPTSKAIQPSPREDIYGTLDSSDSFGIYRPSTKESA